MPTSKMALSIRYEVAIGIAGIVMGLAVAVPGLHINLCLLAFLSALAVLLEAIPIPLGKLTSTLLLGLPIGVMVVYGPAAAVVLVIVAQLCTPFLVGLRPRLATILFNAGQQTLSVIGMEFVFVHVYRHDVHGFDWHLFVAVCIASFAFLGVNHAFIHVLNVMRGHFEPSDILFALGADGGSLVIVLPFSLLMIDLGPKHPLLAPMAMVPLFIFSQTLRMYRRSVLLQRIYAGASRLVDDYNPETIYEEVAKTARAMTSADGVVMYTLSADDQELIPISVDSVVGDSDAWRPIPRSDGGIVWDVIAKNQWEYVPIATRDARISEAEASAFQGSVAVFPLQARGVWHGAIVCYSWRDYAFNELLQYVSVLAAQVSILLANANLYRRLQEQSRRDGATGLFNYRYFYEVLEQRLGSAKKRSQPLTVAIIDVDFFKKVNDTYGHLAGDAVLQTIGQILTEIAGPDSVTARYGGEEFGVILTTDWPEAFELMEKVRLAVNHRVVDVGNYHVKGISVSIGLASYPEHGTDDRDVLLKADSAMYWGAKQQGRNRTAVYSPSIDSQLFVDALTGLYTHHFLKMKVREDFSHGVRRFGVICVDIVAFGRINSQFSFRVGDRLLQETAVIIKECLRHSELVCRFGGDEFLVLIPDVYAAELDVIAERIGKSISSHHFVCDDQVITHLRVKHTTASFDDVANEVDLFTRANDLFADMHQDRDQTYGS